MIYGLSGYSLSMLGYLRFVHHTLVSVNDAKPTGNTVSRRYSKATQVLMPSLVRYEQGSRSLNLR